MKQIFDANWPGGALEQPTAYSIGFHNRTQFAERTRMENTLSYVSSFAATTDTGPVVFITLSDTAVAWPRD